jgi:hypothetical protein
MKFETLMLQTLFAACLLTCLLTLGSMLSPQTTATAIASNHAHAATTASTAS